MIKGYKKIITMLLVLFSLILFGCGSRGSSLDRGLEVDSGSNSSRDLPFSSSCGLVTSSDINSVCGVSGVNTKVDDSSEIPNCEYRTKDSTFPLLQSSIQVDTSGLTNAETMREAVQKIGAVMVEDGVIKGNPYMLIKLGGFNQLHLIKGDRYITLASTDAEPNCDMSQLKQLAEIIVEENRV